MRTPAVVAAGLALVVGLSALGVDDGIDRGRYLAANKALLEQLPSYPGSRIFSMRTLPYYGGDSSSSPVAGYTTLALFRLPDGFDPDRVAAFYERELARDWVLEERLSEPPYAAGPILNYRRGKAGVSVNLESWGGGILELAVDAGG